MEGHQGGVNSVAITSDDKFIVSGSGDSSQDSDNSVRIWNLFEKRQDAVLQGHTGTVHFAIFTTDNKFIVSAGDDKTVRVWNIFLKRQMACVEYSNKITSLLNFDDNQIVVKFDNGTTQTFNLVDKLE